MPRRKTSGTDGRKGPARIGDHLFPKIAGRSADSHTWSISRRSVSITGRPGLEDRIREALEGYRLSLPDERRVLYDRYRLADVAVKVVGIGSVGTRCFVALFFSAENHPLLLQFKEACPSVLEPFAGKSEYENQGERVVMGQRLMQSVERHLPRLVARPARPRFLRAADARHEVVHAAREGFAAQLNDTLDSAAGHWPAPMPNPAMRRPSAAIWASRIRLTRPSARSRWPMPIRPSAIMRRWWRQRTRGA